MKKILFLIILYSFFMMSFISCSANNMLETRLNLLNKETKEEEKFIEDFFEHLKNKSSEDLLKMFSENAMKEDEKIQKSIDYILDTIGENFTYEQPGSYSERDGEKGYKRYSSSFIIKSNDKEYWMRIVTYLKNEDKNEIGINQILFCSSENRREFEKKIYDEYSRQAYGVYVE